MSRMSRFSLVAALAFLGALAACAPYGSDGYYGDAPYARSGAGHYGQQYRPDRRAERSSWAEPRRERDRRRDEEARPRPTPSGGGSRPEASHPGVRQGYRPEQTGLWGPQIGIENRN